MEVDYEACLAALGAISKRVVTASHAGLQSVGYFTENTIQQIAPRGTAGNSTNPPGDLRKSVVILGPYSRGSDAIWSVDTGPTMMYTMQRNYGGGIDAHNPTGRMFFYRFGKVWEPVHVDQVATYFMERSWDEVLPVVSKIMEAPIAKALETS
jgi:hypothetical protein